MGSIIEINDTLQITTEQGFPAELDLEKHKKGILNTDEIIGKTFEFKNKPEIRVFQKPPFRNFFAHNEGSEPWTYWGHIEITELTLDYVNNTTSGKFQITKIYSPEEIEDANKIIDAARFKEQDH